MIGTPCAPFRLSCRRRPENRSTERLIAELEALEMLDRSRIEGCLRAQEHLGKEAEQNSKLTIAAKGSIMPACHRIPLGTGYGQPKS